MLSWRMVRFFARIFAFLLAVSVFAIAVVLVLHIRPESPGGWFVLVLLGAAALTSPFWVYVGVMGRFNGPAPPNEGEGAGLAMGAGIDRARRQEAEEEAFDFD